jgi:hypothetical protein
MKSLRFLIPAAAFVLGHSAVAQSYTYTVVDSKTIITGFSAEPSGAITVPTTLGGYNVTQIGRSAFKDRANITSISFATGANVVKIGATAFQGCTGLQSVVLPSGATAIPSGAFQGCTSLNSVTIPATVTSIGDSAFADCRSLATLSLPSVLASLGESAFLNCRSLTSLTIPSGVTSIPGQLCHECRALSSISLPAGVTEIGYSAFYNCSALTSFTLPDAVTSVGHDAFHGCRGIAGFGINGALATLGEQVFRGCSSLAAITVAAANPSFSSAGGVLFNKAQTSLLLCPEGKTGSYTIPSGVSSLATGAFAHCDGLTGATVSSSLPVIGGDAFYYASSMTSVTIPEGVASIGEWAFAGCSGLTEVTIPASVASMGSDAFHYCSDLVSAVFNGNAPTMGTNVFASTASGFTVYFYAESTGFTTPAWLGYPASVIGEESAMVTWLTANGFDAGTDMDSDPNGDGVSLLMAYAFGLDPNGNLAGSMPKPVLSGGSLSVSFYGEAEGITYSAQASGDLAKWTTEGVTLSEPDAEGVRTASVVVGSAKRFMRVVVVD